MDSIDRTSPKVKEVKEVKVLNRWGKEDSFVKEFKKLTLDAHILVGKMEGLLKKTQYKAYREEKEHDFLDEHLDKIEGSFNSPSPTPCMIIMSGLPGSGKSRFSYAIHENYTRICQDELGSRKACVRATVEALRAGHRVIIDRTNFNEEQRHPFISIAKENWPFPETAAVWAIDCDVPKGVCIARCQLRDDHPTLKPETAQMVINKFDRQFVRPQMKEGFDCIVTLAHGDSELQDALFNRLEHPSPEHIV